MPAMTCVACARIEERQRSALFCHECSLQRQGEQSRAIHAVRAAIVRRELESPTTRECEDCGDPAKFYDHRDYTKPLDVAPVCPSCNKRRGPAFHSTYRPQAEAA
jgi:hypothetical protein